MAKDLVGVDVLRAEGFGVSGVQASEGMLFLFGSVCTRCRFWGGGGGGAGFESLFPNPNYALNPKPQTPSPKP